MRKRSAKDGRRFFNERGEVVTEHLAGGSDHFSTTAESTRIT
jgi:hypothetical protein